LSGFARTIIQRLGTDGGGDHDSAIRALSTVGAFSRRQGAGGGIGHGAAWVSCSEGEITTAGGRQQLDADEQRDDGDGHAQHGHHYSLIPSCHRLSSTGWVTNPRPPIRCPLSRSPAAQAVSGRAPSRGQGSTGSQRSNEHV
jgi:hypothetical protein